MANKKYNEILFFCFVKLRMHQRFIFEVAGEIAAEEKIYCFGGAKRSFKLVPGKLGIILVEVV